MGRRLDSGDALLRETFEGLGIGPRHAIVAVTGSDHRNGAIAVAAKERHQVEVAIARARVDEPERSWPALGVEALRSSELLRRALLDQGRVTAARPKRVLVIGGGPLAEATARALLPGHEVALLAGDGPRVWVPSCFGEGVVIGDVSDPALMDRAGIARADLVLAVAASDPMNLSVALAAKRIFGVG